MMDEVLVHVTKILACDTIRRGGAVGISGYDFHFLHPSLTLFDGVALAGPTPELHISVLRSQQAPVCFCPVLQGLELPPSTMEYYLIHPRMFYGVRRQKKSTVIWYTWLIFRV
jgi:hypothetical protein